MDHSNTTLDKTEYAITWVVRILCVFLTLASAALIKVTFMKDRDEKARDSRELLMVKQIVELEARVKALEEARNGN